MNSITKPHLRTKILRLLPLIISLGVAVYAFLRIATSGLVPLKYIIAGILALTLFALLVSFLWLRYFKTRPRRVVARIVATILMIAVIAGSVFGLYVFERGLSTLNNITTDEAKAVTIETNNSFNIFISGIDTYGDIGVQSRSDVNIVATVNPDTHKVLLTTIPRDSYVSIALGGNDGMDKLTHAGNYGPESSTATVARLLDTDIKGYVRINFTSFIGSIDKMGGITINNPEAFDAYDGTHFEAGELNLTGAQALAYSRERKSLEAGDIDRGKNQQRVVQGILDKMSQVRSISDFETLLGTLSDAIDTNISQTTIRSLINQQINEPSNWTTTSYTLTGKGQTGGLPSYAMPSAELYMYVLDLDSIEKAHEQIVAAMEEE